MMKDYQAYLEPLRQQASESAFVSALATFPQKRAMFAQLTAHLNTLAACAEPPGPDVSA